MGFNSNIPIDVGVMKRKRRLNKKRFFSFLLVMVVLAGCVTAYAIYDDSIFANIKAVFYGDANQKENIESGATMKQNTILSSKNSTSITDNKQKATDEIVPKIDKTKDISVLKKDLEEYIKKYKGQYGIHFKSLMDSTELGVNDVDTYIAASTVKVPINLYLYKKIQTGEIKPDSKMAYISEYDYEGGTGYIQNINGLKDGKTFTVRELSQLSITLSDNIAINMLIRLVGKQNYKDFMKQYGGIVVAQNNVSCPKDMTLYMNGIYDLYKSNPALGQELVDNLENTLFNDRIPKLLPKDVKVAHKIGNQVGALHDVGIVFAEKPYIISIMSKDIDEEEGYDVIANISKMVYDFVMDVQPEPNTDTAEKSSTTGSAIGQ